MTWTDWALNMHVRPYQSCHVAAAAVADAHLALGFDISALLHEAIKQSRHAFAHRKVQRSKPLSTPRDR